MVVRIDKSGRIFLPKAMLQRLGLAPGTDVEVVEEPNGLHIRSANGESGWRQVEGLWVHSGDPETVIDWENVVDQVREERIQAVIGASNS